MVSAGELLLTQLIPVAAVFISNKISSVSTSSHTKRTQKCNLWSVVTAFELAALIPAVFDIVVVIGKSLRTVVLELTHVGSSLSGLWSRPTTAWNSLFTRRRRV